MSVDKFNYEYKNMNIGDEVIYDNYQSDYRVNRYHGVVGTILERYAIPDLAWYVRYADGFVTPYLERDLKLIRRRDEHVEKEKNMSKNFKEGDVVKRKTGCCSARAGVSYTVVMVGGQLCIGENQSSMCSYESIGSIQHRFVVLNRFFHSLLVGLF